MKLYMMCHNCGGEIGVPDNPNLGLLVCPFCHSQNQLPQARLAAESYLAGYRIIRNIETSALHETYIAEDIGQRREVRLQTFASPAFESGLAADYFIAAMGKWLKVKHPNIVKVLEAGRNRSGLFFATSLPVTGMTLEERLWRGGAIPLRPALHLATSLGACLNWLYKEHGIIYGGLNPRNITLTPARDIILANLTLAPILRERPAGLALSQLATTRPGFMSPEQLADPDRMDCQSDMFSMGATLYQMLTGVAPFASLNRAEVVSKHQSTSLQDPRYHCPDLPDKVVWLLEILLAHEPAERFVNWETFLDVLATLDQPKKVWSPQPLKSHSVMIQAAAVAPAPRKHPIRPHRPTMPLYPPTPPPAKRDILGIVVAIIIVLAAIGILVLLLVTPDPPRAPEPDVHAKSSGATHLRTATATEPSRTLPAPSIASPASQSPATPVSAAPAVSAIPAADTNSFQGFYRETRLYAARKPVDYEGLLERYERLRTLVDASQTNLVAKIDEEARQLQFKSAGAFDEAKQAIQEKVSSFVEQKQDDAAIAWLNQYNGPFVKGTRELRERLSRSLLAGKTASAAN